MGRRFVVAVVLSVGFAGLAEAQTFRASLEGGREVGAAGDPDGTGLAVLTIDGSSLKYWLWAKGIAAPTAAHVHAGRAGEAGAVRIDLAPTFQPAVGGVFVATGTVNADPATLQAIDQTPGGFYVNLHNVSFPDGAIRGQLLGDGPSSLAAAAILRGARATPTTGDPDGRGAAALVVDGQTLFYYVWVRDVASPGAARIHRGDAGSAGALALDLGASFVSGVAAGSVGTDQATAADLLARPDTYYVDVVNAEFPGGALRGQLEPTETVLHFPVVARNPGAGTSNFKTDLRIQLLTDEDSTVFAEWYPTNNGGLAGPSNVTEVVVAARGEAVLDDVVGTLFGLTGRGAMRLASTAPFRAAANVYNDQRFAGSGTFGQFQEGLGLDRALTSGALPLGSHRPRTDGLDFRTNLGFFNPRPRAVTARFNVRLPGGALIAAQTLTFPPFANDIRAYHDVITAIPTGQRTQPNFLITYAADAPLFIYSSVVDNKTDDGLHQPAASAPAGLTSPPGPPPNSPPNGVITTPAGALAVTVGQAVSFVGTATDPEGQAVTVRWDFGDGVASTDLATSHTYLSAGTFAVTFTATDAPGLADPTPDTRTITVTAPSQATLSAIQAQFFTPLCAGCHPPNGGGMDLRAGQSWASIVNVNSSEQPALKRVMPGDPDNSYLVRKLAGGPGISGGRMPLGGPFLSAAEIDIIRQWILEGAQDN
ncbi:MAG: CHRD domain-containing protein [Acidobacteria bacterium]|nr:CHRD domain-containing protein [Acidobacteriota bacterium]